MLERLDASVDWCRDPRGDDLRVRSLALTWRVGIAPYNMKCVLIALTNIGPIDMVINRSRARDQGHTL